MVVKTKGNFSPARSYGINSRIHKSLWDENCVSRKNKAIVNLKTGRFGNVDLAVIITAVQTKNRVSPEIKF